MSRLEELMAMPRVDLPADVPDDEHNRVGGLVQLIADLFPVGARIMELGSGRGVSTEVFALLCKEVHTTDIYFPGSEAWREEFDCMAKRYPNITQYYSHCDLCIHKFADKSLDAVYIDENHIYERVKIDIEHWLPKIKDGGIICGHDYIDRPEHNFGVIRAVNEAFGAPDRIYKDTSWAVILKPSSGEEK